MKKIAFSLVSILTALLISVTLISCGGGEGGGGGGGSSGSGSTAGEQGEPSGASVYGSSYAYPEGFYTRADNAVVGTMWVFLNSPNTGLFIADATHAFHCVRQGSSNMWVAQVAYEIQITNGANGYIRFSNSSMTPAKYSYNITDNILNISNTYHGTKNYQKLNYIPSDPNQQYIVTF